MEKRTQFNVGYLLFALLAIFLVQHTTQIVLGLIGFATILVEYLFTIDDPERTIQLHEGAFIAALGFLLVFLAGMLRTGRWATSPPPPPKKK
jgi:hypothetical protein